MSLPVPMPMPVRACIRSRLSLKLFLLLQEKGVRMIAVGIGNKVLKDELKKIAGENVLMVSDFDKLLGRLKEIETVICGELYTK